MMTWDDPCPELQGVFYETDPVVHGLTDLLHTLAQVYEANKDSGMNCPHVDAFQYSSMTRVVLLLSCEIVHYHVTNLVDLALDMVRYDSSSEAFYISNTT